MKENELLKRIEKVDIKIGGKNLNWIKNKQRLWREYREKEGIDEKTERELICQIVRRGRS